MVSRELLEACRRGEPGAFEELVERTHGRVHALAYRMVEDTHEAQDVAQEAYLRVWRGLRGFRHDARFETWLHRIVVNAAFTHLKRKGRFGVLVREDPEVTRQEPEEPSRPVEAMVDRDVLRRALGRLSPALRTVVVLKDMYGLSIKEIAQELGVGEGAVKVRIHRARKRLKDEVWAQTT